MSSSRVLTGLMKSVVQLIEAGICSATMTVLAALCLMEAGELLARFPSDGGQDVDCTCFEHSRFPAPRWRQNATVVGDVGCYDFKSGRLRAGY